MSPPESDPSSGRRRSLSERAEDPVTAARLVLFAGAPVYLVCAIQRFTSVSYPRGKGTVLAVACSLPLVATAAVTWAVWNASGATFLESYRRAALAAPLVGVTTLVLMAVVRVLGLVMFFVGLATGLDLFGIVGVLLMAEGGTSPLFGLAVPAVLGGGAALACTHCRTLAERRVSADDPSSAELLPRGGGLVAVGPERVLGASRLRRLGSAADDPRTVARLFGAATAAFLGLFAVVLAARMASGSDFGVGTVVLGLVVQIVESTVRTDVGGAAVIVGLLALMVAGATALAWGVWEVVVSGGTWRYRRGAAAGLAVGLASHLGFGALLWSVLYVALAGTELLTTTVDATLVTDALWTGLVSAVASVWMTAGAYIALSVGLGLLLTYARRRVAGATTRPENRR